jgi:CRISPR-associated protein Cas2
MAHYLICYDIANPRRLGRVHRRAVRHAMFVQYSVYYLNGSEKELHEMLDEISEEIDPEEDDVRAYPVEPLKNAIQIGQAWLPDEILLL